jgi:serine/threonine-protein kinase
MAGDERLHLEGVVLERKYRVIRVVAEGGFSVVYEGEHTALRIPIAIKVLRAPPGGPPARDLEARFAFEARTIARLTHPDIIRVLDTGVYAPGEGASGVASGVPWIVLEWLVGETLKQHLAARRGAGGRRPSEALALLRPVFGAIAHAHDEGIAHRDLKPSNIMLARSRAGATAGVSAKVLDFGIAKLLADADAPGGGTDATEGSVRAFSRRYAAPEQLAGARTGPWTDVHALALILTELLTDQLAYAAGGGHEIGERIFDPVRPTPARLGVDVGPWEPILRRALALRSADRPRDAAALLAELEACVAGADAVHAAGRAAAPTGASGPTAPGEVTATAGSAVGDAAAFVAAVPVVARRGGAARRALVLAASTLLAAVALLAVWRSTGSAARASAAPTAPSPAPVARAERPPLAPAPPFEAPVADGANARAVAVHRRPPRRQTPPTVAPPSPVPPSSPAALVTPSSAPRPPAAVPYVLE